MSEPHIEGPSSPGRRAWLTVRPLLVPLLALAATFALLIYAGYRDVQRAVPGFELDRIGAQAETLRSEMEPFLLAGLPLDQFPGFGTMTEPILRSDPTIGAFAVVDADEGGRTVFSSAREGGTELVSIPEDRFEPSQLAGPDQALVLSETPDVYRVSLDLNNKFEPVGRLDVLVPRAALASRVNRGFWFVPLAALALLVLYGGTLVALRRAGRARFGTQALVYAAAVLAMGLVLLYALVSLYGEGVQARSRGLAASLAQRLAAPIQLGLDLGDLGGLDETLRQYQRLNPDVSFLALTDGDRVVAHTEPARVGTAWSAPSGDDVLSAPVPGSDALVVRVATQRALVLEKVRRNVQGFVLAFVGALALYLALLLGLRSGRITAYFPQMVPKIIVLALSLFLLAFVGYGEALRTYPSFAVDSLAAHAETVESSMEPFLFAGLPLAQLPGFATTTGPIIASDPSIAAILVTDDQGRIVFSNTGGATPQLRLPEMTAFAPSALDKAGRRYRVAESAQFYRVTLDVRNKFEKVGELHVLMPRARVAERLSASFGIVPWAGAVVVAGFSVAVFVITRRRIYATRPLAIAYAIAFTAMAAVIVVTLVLAYSDGVQARAKALASSLGHRLSAPLELGLDVTELGGLDQALSSYQRLNPDLSFVALTVGDKVAFDTDAAQVGSDWHPPATDFVYDVELAPRASAAEPVLRVHVGIPRALVLEKLWRSVKNFVVLFVACGFISMVLFNLMRALRAHAEQVPGHEVTRAEVGFQLVQTFLFASVLVEGLSASFLSTYFTDLGRSSGASPTLVSAIFTVYFLAIATSLVPAGRMAERGWMKPLMIAGAGLTAASLLVMSSATSFVVVFALRALAGFGQGMLAVGVQSYTLEVSAGRQQTRGSAAIVFGSGAGLVSGIAIGALLAVYIGPRGVFALGGAVNLLLVPYALLLIPAVAISAEGLAKLKGNEGLLRNFARVAHDAEFIKTMLLIGMPAKAVLTGVVLFAVPIVLAAQKYAQEDIGQIVLLYSAGTLIITPYVARLVDKTGRTASVLFAGALVSGVGLVLIGLVGWSPLEASVAPWVGTAVVILGMLVLGVGHGVIGAPLITHVTNTGAAQALGRASAASVYRFFERFGNVGGPLIAAQLLAVTQGGALSIAWVGAVTVGFGAVFAFNLMGRRFTAPAPAFAMAVAGAGEALNRPENPAVVMSGGGAVGQSGNEEVAVVETTEVAKQIEEIAQEEHREIEAERQASHVQERFRNVVAALIAGLAALLAISSLLGEETSTHLLTGAILTADSYAFYQAKNIRQTTYQLAADDLELTTQNPGSGLSPDARQAFQKKIEQYRATVARYESEPDPEHPNDPTAGEGKKELLARAAYWEASRDHAALQFPNFHYAEALFQISIVLGSVAIITHRRWIVGTMVGVGVIALLLLLNGQFLFFTAPGAGH